MSALPSAVANRELLRRVLAALEIPECGCSFRRIHCDCRRYQDTGDCNHPPRYPDPCAHVRATVHTLDYRKWIYLLRQYAPEEFRIPPPPPERTICLPGNPGKVEVMRRRVAAGFSPFHPDDLTPDACDGVGIEVERRCNGSIRRKGFRQLNGKGGRDAS